MIFALGLSGCEGQDPEPSPPSACALLDDALVNKAVGTQDWTAQNDSIEADDDRALALCDIVSDDVTLTIKSSYPADPVVIEENIRQQLDSPDFEDTLAEPCTAYTGAPLTGIGCQQVTGGSERQDAYIYGHADDTSFSVVLSDAPPALPSSEQLEIAERLTTAFLDGFAAFRDSST
ncbi:hypothetical protein GCM10009821_28210 [Aeromicrobium halocynthiae]|uniref:DUF3558 domain-containing protein n=1 Tax=Aeromicrobium halocynthiae TaxID=560557 RepID=A0ABN2W7X3_9ACTN